MRGRVDPVDPLTLETAVPDVYALGDVTSVGTPKAGVFAEGQAAVVADAIVARHRGGAEPAPYGGRGICYVELATTRSDGSTSPSGAVSGRRAGSGTLGRLRHRQAGVRVDPGAALVRAGLDHLLSRGPGRRAVTGQSVRRKKTDTDVKWRPCSSTTMCG